MHEEKIDCFSFGNRFLDGELDRIDAVERLIHARAQQHLQPRDDARTPRLGRFERNQSLFELFFRRSWHYKAIRNVETVSAF
jgi:hypothetical protein